MKYVKQLPYKAVVLKLDPYVPGFIGRRLRRPISLNVIVMETWAEGGEATPCVHKSLSEGTYMSVAVGQDVSRDPAFYRIR